MYTVSGQKKSVWQLASLRAMTIGADGLWRMMSMTKAMINDEAMDKQTTWIHVSPAVLECWIIRLFNVVTIDGPCVVHSPSQAS
jgi:hypothetical protein